MNRQALHWFMTAASSKRTADSGPSHFRCYGAANEGPHSCRAFVIGMYVVSSQPFMPSFLLPVYEGDVWVFGRYFSKVGVVAVPIAGGGAVDGDPEDVAVRAQVVQKALCLSFVLAVQLLAPWHDDHRISKDSHPIHLPRNVKAGAYGSGKLRRQCSSPEARPCCHGGAASDGVTDAAHMVKGGTALSFCSSGQEWLPPAGSLQYFFSFSANRSFISPMSGHPAVGVEFQIPRSRVAAMCEGRQEMRESLLPGSPFFWDGRRSGYVR